MSERPFDADPFFRLVSGLEDELSIETRGSYVVVSLADDMKHLREAYDDHVKAALEAEPGVEMTPEDYGFVEAMMNRRDVTYLRELSMGDTVVVGPGAFTVYETEGGLACENIIEGECLVGEFHRVAVAPVPTLDAMIDGQGIRDDAYEVALILVNPHLEVDGADPYRIPSPYIVVAISDTEVEFMKRLMPGQE